MTIEKQLHKARLLSSVAATVISLACGTNYVYSAWAPQFADRLKLSATDSNLIGLAGNLGMYALGVPIGVVIDSRGPRPAVILGSILLGLGYWPLHSAYDAGEGSVPLMCLYMFLVGFGGCMAFLAAVKTSALNWPHHRGTATAFPLAAFGLSAFFFSLVGSIFTPGNPSKFLMLLAIGTFGLPFVGFFFLHVYPHAQHYHAVPPTENGMADSQELHRAISQESKTGRANPAEPGMSSTATINNQGTVPGQGSTEENYNSFSNPAVDVEAMTPKRCPGEVEDTNVTETCSLISRRSSSASSLPGDVLVQSSVDMDRSHRLDIRGWKLLTNLEFWQQFLIMGLLAGIGLMTINNIGNDTTALWNHWDDSIDHKTLVLQQQMHVSILSLGNFSGRLLSGVGSDFLVKVIHASRVWCLVIGSLIFAVAQLCALTIENPNFLGFVSGFSGLGYGFLFGVTPSIVAESFGIHGLSTNWGFMSLAPVISSNVFNLFYGSVFDAHSIVEPDGSRTCTDGLECYRSAYMFTLGACGLSILVTLYVIWHQKQERLKDSGKARIED